MLSSYPLPEIIKVKGKKQSPATKLKNKKKAVAPIVPIREIFSPGCLGHTALVFAVNPALPPSIYIEDFLVDSTGVSRGGESVNPVIQVGLNSSRRMIFHIKPEACKSGFKVKKPIGIKSGHFGFRLGRQSLNIVADGGGFYEAYPATVIFNNLTGTAPAITYAYFFIRNGNNNSYKIIIEGVFTKNFSFSDIQIVCRYPGRNLLPQFGFYKTFTTGVPFVLAGNNDICFCSFGYSSEKLIDLGPIIELI